MLIEIVKPTSMHLGRGMKSAEDFSTVTGKCCNWQPLLATFKFTNPGRTSLVFVISNFYVEQAELLIAGNAQLYCHSLAFIVLALIIAWNWNCFFFCQIVGLLLFIVFFRRHPSCLKKRRELTRSISISLKFINICVFFWFSR